MDSSTSVTTQSIRAIANSVPLRTRLRTITFAWFLGAGWAAIAGGAILFAFNTEMGLGQHSFTWGLLSAMPFVATLLQVVGSLMAEASGKNKLLFMAGLLVQRAMWLPIGLLPYFVLPYSTAAAVSILLLLFLQAAGGQFGTPPWTTWMADLIPPRIRGRYFGLRHRIAMSMYLTMALLSGWLLNVANSPTRQLRLPWIDGRWHAFTFPLTTLELCTWMFVLGAALGVADILCFVRTPETRGRRNPDPPNLGELLALPLRDRSFVRFLAFYAVFIVGSPGTMWYIWDNARQHLGMSYFGVQIMLVIVPTVAEMIFAPVWGKLIDRVGRKTVMMLSMAYLVLLPVCWLLVLPQYWWMGFVIPILGNVCWNGSDQCNTHWLLHLASGAKGSSAYQAVFALVVCVTGTASGLLLGGMAWLGKRLAIDIQLGPFHFDYLLAVMLAAAFLRGAAYFLLLPRMHDDRNRQPVGQALRYVLGAVTEAIGTAVRLPLRLLGLRDTRTGDDDDAPPR